MDGVAVPLIPCRQPYAWRELLGFLAPRVIEGVEEVQDSVYRRVISLNSKNENLTGWFAASYDEKKFALRTEVSSSLAPVLERVIARLRRLFDVDSLPEEVARTLGEMAEACPGLRVPGCFDAFEMGVRAILGQQVTVKAAHMIVTRVVSALGEKIVTPFSALYRVFPTPKKLLETDGDTLGRLGVVRSRQRALHALAEFSLQGGLEPGTNAEEQIDKLKKLHGIGDWTAHYLAMRALNYPDAFPHTDSAIRAAMGNRPPNEIIKIAEQWRPWRAYAAMYLWLEHGKKSKKR